MKKIIVVFALMLFTVLSANDKVNQIQQGSQEYNRWVSYTSTAILCGTPYSSIHTVFAQNFNPEISVMIMPKTNGNEIYMVSYAYNDIGTKSFFVVTFVSVYKSKKISSEFIVLQGFENGEKLFETTNDDAANRVHALYSKMIGEE